MPYDNTKLTPKISFSLRSDSAPAAPVCADRNPYWDRNATVYLNGTDCTGTEPPPTCKTDTGYKDEYKTGNSACHQRDGQNVLYVDTHVRMEKFPNVGLTKDNIWKPWANATAPTTTCDRELGVSGMCGGRTDGDNTYLAPASEQDSFLVSETNNR